MTLSINGKNESELLEHYTKLIFQSGKRYYSYKYVKSLCTTIETELSPRKAAMKLIEQHKLIRLVDRNK